MCTRYAPLALVLLVLVTPAAASWVSPFISEFHYDNAGPDVGEFVAVTGPDGLDLSGWRVVLYNGANGLPYRSVALDGVLDGNGAGLAEAYWPVAGLQNGPDALALVSAAAEVVDFVAYEAQVVALGDVAQNLTARLLPIGEDSGSPVGSSLQRRGAAGDWAWVGAPATPGRLNAGLVGTAQASVPVAGAWVLWLAALVGWRLASARRGVYVEDCVASLPSRHGPVS